MLTIQKDGINFACLDSQILTLKEPLDHLLWPPPEQFALQLVIPLVSLVSCLPVTSRKDCCALAIRQKEVLGQGAKEY